ncbi:MAG: tetratricopeptide repeat protein [Candidatus Omnitrophica bacterium]|nr:tetratricopeptide repeat protein [Candidatus Omnitrophota bacterium]MDE2008875.1 tetratricopeptide repeat protein [Candidatus Omnitrophota bacterium]MDE2213562.1 tetratricopeptide repeat protein [Candidatus Omnitrophota bacterium]MDE2230537.1 tetratricopeptide repeat protein [Candidatus Omnitrophota bacterium]
MTNWIKAFPILFVLGLLVYANSLNNKFIIDDYSYLSAPALSETKYISYLWNPYYQGALGLAGNSGHLNFYRPLALMLSNFCFAAFKKHFWQYHLLNLFFFVSASSLIYIFIKKLTASSLQGFLTALFYLVHPINGIIVNYITAGIFALQVICILCAILFLWVALERRRNRYFYALSLMFCFLSLFWNESGVMVPFYIGAFVLLYRQELLKEKALYLLPYFLIVGGYLVLRLNFFNMNEHIPAKMALYHMTFWQYSAALFQIYSWYIGRLFYPRGIVMQWLTSVPAGHIFLNVLGLFLLLLVFVLLYIRFSNLKACRLGLAWILIGFLPACLAAFRRPADGVIIEPHWFVFSSIGFFMVAAFFCTTIWGRNKKAGLVLVAVLTVAWGSVSYGYNQLWADQITYTRYWLSQIPHTGFLHLYLAEADLRAGDLRDAKINGLMALSGQPSNAMIYYDLGVIEKAGGHFKEAESDYLKALELSPYMAVAYNNLGSLYLMQGRLGPAREYFSQSLIFDPLLIKSRIGLALIDKHR